MKDAKRNRIVVALSMTALLLALTACSGNDGNSAASGAGSTGSESAASTGSGDAGAAADPLGKYEQPVTVSTIMGINDIAQKAISIKNSVLTDNIWTRGYESELGIKIKYLWSVPGAQMEQKLNVAISSNDLPDIIPVNSRQFKLLVDSGVALDITELFDQYASDFTKKMMDEDNHVGLDQATVNGKLMGLPSINGSIDGAHMIWLRADWLKNLNLQAPKTMEDVFKIAEAFTKNDPDQNGKNDTTGLALTKDLIGTGLADLDGFFEGYHAYVNGWVDDGSGQLVYGAVQPQMKTALAKLADMYKSGYIDNEFSVKDGAKVAESLIAGKVGMMFGQHWVPFYPLQDAKNKDPKADWQAYPIVSADEQPAKPLINGSATTYYVINKNMAHPEAAIKLYNYYYKKRPCHQPGLRSGLPWRERRAGHQAGSIVPAISDDQLLSEAKLIYPSECEEVLYG
ncbi:extracellular solute-binding protein [Cohnella rhizosphaerae]|uniref:Extracellular solute-binding protein n=1 Tax=Cohnella rhizosphaerae TaxID=1457232 RepID=A0A9X4KRW9_9BACL|nr:extracellular solute-binding protein [Cohnella rhizosphaerae]MDG0809702.1 extracellular solute-binding protein [Cohnella rhizosphaerae]